MASPPTLTSPTATAIGSTTATLGTNVTATGGASLTARGTAWGTSANPTGNALSSGTTTGVFTQARTALTAGTKIFYRGYATNSVGTGYSPDGSFYTESATQASMGSFTSVGQTSMAVNWARSNGDGVIVLMRQVSVVNTDPTDGTYSTYTANAAFGSGTQIGTLATMSCAKGQAPVVAVTGLTAGTTYYLAVYEYKGTVDTAGVDQGTNYKPSPATDSQATTAGSATLYTYTFDYTGSVQQLAIPTGATNIQFTVKGAGGGGGREDNVQNQENGKNGHSAVMSSAGSGVTLRIYVGGGGQAGSNSSYYGAGGGWGYLFGGAGGAGDEDQYNMAYGGAGGGGQCDNID